VTQLCHHAIKQVKLYVIPVFIGAKIVKIQQEILDLEPLDVANEIAARGQAIN